MKEITIKKHIRYLFGIAFMVFILNKLLLRPWILENDVTGIFLIFTNSLPNMIEGIFGTLILSGILSLARLYFKKNLGIIKDTYLYISAVLIASVYVISQELKFHNLGGNNVYDFYDIIASIIGIAMTFIIIQKYGFTDKTEDSGRHIND